VLSHGSGILIGWASYGLVSCILPFDSTTAQVTAAALSLGLIGAWMVAAKISHPPAASTTLIVALGLMVQWQELIAVMAAIIMLTAECYLINRLSGIASPVWAANAERQGDGLVVAALQTDVSATRKDSYAEIADQIVARQRLPAPPSS